MRPRKKLTSLYHLTVCSSCADIRDILTCLTSPRLQTCRNQLRVSTCAEETKFVVKLGWSGRDMRKRHCNQDRSAYFRICLFFMLSLLSLIRTNYSIGCHHNGHRVHCGLSPCFALAMWPSCVLLGPISSADTW
jgi:hypothetical protein